jgi:surface protein
MIINLATINFDGNAGTGGGGSSKPLITEPLVINVWEKGTKVFSPADNGVDGFNSVTINTSLIGENSKLDFSVIGWDTQNSDIVNSKYNDDIAYSKTLLENWNNGNIAYFSGDKNLIYCPAIDLSDTFYISSFFSDCTNLQYVPPLDLSNITSTSRMFYNCSSLITVSQLNTSNVTNMYYMFYNCSKLQSIPLLNTTNVTDMHNMFEGCSSLITIPLLNTSKVTNMSGTFRNCSSLITIPQINTSQVTNMGNMFEVCTNLQSIPQLNTTNVTNMSYFFGTSGTLNNLTDIGGFKNLKINWNDAGGLNKCPNLTYQSIINILENLYDFRGNGDNSTTRTLRINSNSYDLLTDADKTMAVNKGWNIAY